jgi:hypothetical protein
MAFGMLEVNQLQILDCGLQIEISDVPRIKNPQSAFRNLIYSSTQVYVVIFQP